LTAGNNSERSVIKTVKSVLTKAWTAKREGGQGLSTKFFRRVDDLFESIMEILDQAMAADSTTLASTKADIKTFLFGDYENNDFDDCVFWHLLDRAAEVEPVDFKESKASEIIGEMIIEHNAYLAFENLQNPTFLVGKSSEYKSIKTRCSVSTEAWSALPPENHVQYKRKSTPFHNAAKHGNFAIIKLMRKSLVHIAKIDLEPIYDLIKSGDPAKTRTTALQYAAEAEHGSVETLSALLGFECLIKSNQLDETFAAAVDEGSEDIVSAFIDQENLNKDFVKSSHILAAMKKMPDKNKDKRQSYMIITKKLIELAAPTELTDEAIEMIIEEQSKAERQSVDEANSTLLGWMDMWAAVKARPDGLPEDITSKLLHLAVYHQSIFFVTECLKYPKYSKWATVQNSLPRSNNRNSIPKTDEHFPLYYNSKIWKEKETMWVDREGSSKIRTMLVSSTVRQTNKMQKLSDIFYKSKLRELCFDISRFNSKKYRVSDFVHSLIHHSETETLLSYEETIRYAEFPALDLEGDEKEAYVDNMYLPIRHTEVFDALDWLRDQKGVQRIVELKVPDRLINAHDEARIAECLDLSLSVLGSAIIGDDAKATNKRQTNDKIKELHLYSSGRRAAIDHWLGDDGIPTLTKASETVTEEYCKEVINFIFVGLDRMKKKYEDQPTCNFRMDYGTVDSVFWNPTHTLVDLDEIAHRVTPRLAKFLKSLGDFIPARENEIGQKIRRTRVAIIDNGILSITPRTYDKIGGKQNRDNTEEGASVKSPGAKGAFNYSSSRDKNIDALGEDQKYEASERKSLWSSIKAGRSFVDDGVKVSPWLFASDSHGTQMANLICAMDPFCELYVARVSEGKYGITPDRAARAIQWALEKEVDIISMSIALLDPGKDNMEWWVNKAREKGVIIVCTTHDEGTRSPTCYPAEWKQKGILVITACDEYGRLLRDIDEKQYDYMVQGQNVAAGVIPFVESSDFLTGSSVSTALAAGLSSLILTCFKVARLQYKESDTESELGGSSSGWGWESAGKFPYAEGQVKTVSKYLDQMVTKGTKHVVLEKFGNIDTTTKEGDEIHAFKVLQEWFKMQS
ncbi:hypothetical protein HDV63DRAFT_414849, partial [Trichoderma sp. SZMC 28014]